MLNVFITVDTEFWPRRAYSGPSDYLADFRRDIHGETPNGRLGLGYQVDLLNAHGLRAVFFVEALCAYAVGAEPLKETVQLIQVGGQDVQLHVHTEWLNRMRESILPGRSGQHIRHFSEDEQALLIGKGLAMLKQCGAENVCAFRAGNFGADFRTLRALARNKILYDTSHYTANRSAVCEIHMEDPLLQPRNVCGVIEFPVTFFRDFRRRNRPVQLTACSSGEIEYALFQAWKRGWFSMVIVSHSFELLRGRNRAKPRARPDRIVVKRFERLCRFLEQHRDKFRTSTFSDPPAIDASAETDSKPLRARTIDTSIRLLEQLRRRIVE